MLNTFKSRLDKHWLDQDVLYNFHSELTGNGGSSICMWCCKRYGQRGISAPVHSHWIGLDLKPSYPGSGRPNSRLVISRQTSAVTSRLLNALLLGLVIIFPNFSERCACELKPLANGICSIIPLWTPCQFVVGAISYRWWFWCSNRVF